MKSVKLQVNAELLNNLGNFVNRALTFVSRFFGKVIPAIHLTEQEDTLLAEVAADLEDYDALLSAVKLRDGISKVLSVSRRGNLYMQTAQPWVLVKGSDSDKSVDHNSPFFAVNYVLCSLCTDFLRVRLSNSSCHAQVIILLIFNAASRKITKFLIGQL